MSLIRLDQLCLDYGDQPLLDQADLLLEEGERVCLVGRNGAGKTTLLNVIAGHTRPDSGEVWRKPGLRIARLEQALPEAEDKTVFEIVSDGLADLQQLRREYAVLTTINADAAVLRKMERLQHAIEAQDGWNIDTRIETVISALQVPAKRKMRELSGGWRRRVALAKALVCSPELLLLDEPTNHLDILTIEWLEKQIRFFKGSVLFITHDRRFLQALATRIVELDRGHLSSWPGDYRAYLQEKEKRLAEEERHHREFDKKLAEEEVWIRQGIKARRTRNEGRVRALENLRVIRAQRRTVQGTANFKIADAESSGHQVIEAFNICYQYDEQPLIEKFSGKILRGDRIGLIGNNGAGKSTLLRILLGELPPQQGKVKHGTHLEVAYFDQLRQALDVEKTVLDNVGQGREFIFVNGKERHVISYLADFLFSAQRVRSPVKSLSGGERNRLLLAQLFAKPANLLVLDEPTNDLDIETLEILEQRLLEFKGTVLIVSHDRSFLDNVVTSTLAFEGEGHIQEYIGGYEDWLRQSGRLQDFEQIEFAQKDKTGDFASKKLLVPNKKLSYKLQRELDMLPAHIELLERQLLALQEQTLQTTFYAQNKVEIQRVLEEMSKLQADLHTATARWEELELMQTNM